MWILLPTLRLSARSRLDRSDSQLGPNFLSGENSDEKQRGNERRKQRDLVKMMKSCRESYWCLKQVGRTEGSPSIKAVDPLSLRRPHEQDVALMKQIVVVSRPPLVFPSLEKPPPTICQWTPTMCDGHADFLRDQTRTYVRPSPWRLRVSPSLWLDVWLSAPPLASERRLWASSGWCRAF